MDVKYIGGDVPWTLPFGDHFFSGSQPSFTDTNKNSLISANDLESIARRHGFEPLYSTNNKQSQIKDSSSNENNSQWMNAGVLFTDKTIQPDLTGIHHTDFHDDHGHTFCYLCSINQHHHERTKPRDQSQRRKLIPYNNPKALKARSSSLDRVSQDPSTFHLTSYQFIVRTGTKQNGGTRAQVFLYMYGTENNWTSINLHARKNSNIDGFPSGSIRTFCLKGPDIGQLKHLNVNLVGARSDKEWFLKEIEITNLNTSVTWLCEFNCWLPKKEAEEYHHPIKPLIGRPTELRFDNLSVYILQIRTGDKAFAGTDSVIQVTIRGSKSTTRRLALTSDHSDLFEQNQLDTFAIVGWDIGDLLDITVESDRSQVASDWDLKEMIMWKMLPPDDYEHFQVYFPVNTWIGDKQSKFKAKRDTYQSNEYHPRGPTCYHIAIKTGKDLGAGTDANVFIIIYGKTGRTAIHLLDNPGINDFERNTTSEFTIMDIDVGQIEQIKIWHDDTGVGSAWLLDSVIIRKKHSTCRSITNIFTQRIDKISKALYRQAFEQMKKSHEVRVPSAKENQQYPTDQRSSRLKDDDDLIHNRGILRSPIDKTNLHKSVRWNEQSMGSQDEPIPVDTKRMKHKQTLIEQNRQKSASSVESGHYDHQAYWISTHNYSKNKWLIKSIEETNRFDLDQSTRTLFLSDRPDPKIKTTITERDDDVYEFEANRWLDKDKHDRKLEVYLKPKSMQLSKHTQNETKFKTSTDTKHLPSSAHDNQLKRSSTDDKYDDNQSKKSSTHDKDDDNQLKRSSHSDLKPLKSSPRDSARRRLNDFRLPPQTDQPEDDFFNKKNNRSSSPIQHSKSSHINDHTSVTASNKQLLQRVSNEPPYHARSAASSAIDTRSSTSSNQHPKSPKFSDEKFNSLATNQQTLTKKSTELPTRQNTATRSVPQLSPHQTTGYSGYKSAYDLPKDNY